MVVESTWWAGPRGHNRRSTTMVRIVVKGGVWKNVRSLAEVAV